MNEKKMNEKKMNEKKMNEKKMNEKNGKKILFPSLSLLQHVPSQENGS